MIAMPEIVMCTPEELANLSAAICHMIGTGAVDTDLFDEKSDTPLIERVYFELRRMNMEALKQTYGSIDALMMVGDYQTVMNSFVSIPELVFPKAVEAGYKWRDIILEGYEELPLRDEDIYRLVLNVLLLL